MKLDIVYVNRSMFLTPILFNEDDRSKIDREILYRILTYFEEVYDSFMPLSRILFEMLI